MNKVILIGNVGKEPEVRYYAEDQAVAKVSLATTERGYTLPNGTRIPDRTDWHTLIFSKRLAKVAEQYIHKGDKIYVDGRLQYRTYDDKKGIQHSVTEIFVDNLEMLSPRSNAAPATPAAPATAPQQNQANDAAPAVDNNIIAPF